MGRFHRHGDGTVHTHEHQHDDGTVHTHEHQHDGVTVHGEGTALGGSADGIGQADGKADLGDHSGYGTGPERIEVLERIFSENDAAAAANRAALDAAGVVA
ncbi:MAG: hypothetical protein LBD90_01525, partial [Bifidobacteriaceae bacterium]|nr:hypothetical protein [Bifidobacteriaceae bacterium]